MRARPHIASVIVDPNDPYHYVQIRGEVIGITEEGAEDHIRDLSLKYRGHRDFNLRGETRVIYKVRPDHVQVR
jgi:hypothetical protein